jgi:hypothetical protein
MSRPPTFRRRLILTLAALSPFLAVTALCLGFKENYPFSDFPMYSTFTDQTFYVYVADQDGRPVPVQDITYARTSKLKRIYDTGLKKARDAAGKRKRDLAVAERRAAGLETLQWLFDTTRPEGQAILRRDYRALQLYHVDVLVREGTTVEAPPELVAELPLSP